MMTGEVTASTIAEFTFCPRAGILTHEGGFSDPEEELPVSGLTSLVRTGGD